MPSTQNPSRLAKMLAYVLARHPEEFGLVPDRQGYVRIRELLQALSEEPGWGYVRRSHIDEILFTLRDAPFEIDDTRIRAVDRGRLPAPEAAEDLPKLLYTCIRRRAHPFAMENGIRPADGHEVILSSDRDLAQRMGKRRDREAVTLTVNVGQAAAKGVTFQSAGGGVFLSGAIPPGCFTGPPPPPAALEARPREQPPAPRARPEPGSFVIDLEDLQRKPPGDREKRKRKEIEWKKGVGRGRRGSPPWKRP